METQNSFSRYHSHVGFRIIIIGILSIILLIPATLIQFLIDERQQRRNGAILEVSEKWGKPQTIAGPILSVPFKTYIKDEKGNLITETHYAHFLPDNIFIESKIYPEIRYRGIYEVILYNTEINIRGNFLFPHFNDLNIPEENILWKDIFFGIGISDLKGMKENINIKWNNSELSPTPGMKSTDILPSGISFNPELNQNIQNYNFSLDINLNGSKEIRFIPVGRNTTVTISSNWSNPSFIGEFLPIERQITSDSVIATWKILNLNRNYPQKWIGEQYKIFDSSFGLELLLPIDEYQRTMRTSKYAIMFIGLTFLSFFIIEILNKKILHPIQYLLIGFALIIFYTLLLSISEHIKFNYAYLIASSSIILMITLYTKSVLKNKLITFLMFGILTILYGYLFIVLQLQDYALLFGSIGLFFILSIIMYVTRRIDWFSIGKN
jgi:inner membrane protein